MTQVFIKWTTNILKPQYHILGRFYKLLKSSWIAHFLCKMIRSSSNYITSMSLAWNGWYNISLNASISKLKLCWESWLLLFHSCFFVDEKKSFVFVCWSSFCKCCHHTISMFFDRGGSSGWFKLNYHCFASFFVPFRVFLPPHNFMFSNTVEMLLPICWYT